jgi:hypothetical protein
VDAQEFMDLSRRYRITGVPKTIVNDTVEILGGLPEADFVDAVLQRADVAPPRSRFAGGCSCALSSRSSCCSLSRLPSAVRATGEGVISVDMEGISGINGDDQTSAGQAEYARGRKLMVEDANAAIRGASPAAPPRWW